MSEIECLKLDLREAELKLDRAKFKLKRQMDWLVEDFEEYKNAEPSPENYASLVAIFRKTLRALEMSDLYKAD